MSLDVTLSAMRPTEVYTANITHNLSRMAEAAGIYQHLWRPDELGLTKAGELIQPLREGLNRLLNDPAHFTTYNPPNGWGSYDRLVDFVVTYLSACERNPDATIEISR